MSTASNTLKPSLYLQDETYPGLQSVKTMPARTVGSNAIEEPLNNINPHMASDHIILKTPILHGLFQKSINEGLLPYQWKIQKK